VSYEQAMTAPICKGAGCQQGRCGSPLKCSGMTAEADAAVAKIKASIPRYELRVTMEDEPETAGGLVLAILGVLSTLGLVLLVWLVYTAWRWFL
jgi:hypothetical protein